MRKSDNDKTIQQPKSRKIILLKWFTAYIAGDMEQYKYYDWLLRQDSRERSIYSEKPNKS